jgi:histone acetyltransferase 1
MGDVLVSSKEEVDSSDISSVKPVDLNDFFDGDGKIYGYQGLKINVWINSISLHSYADITYQSTINGDKGITDLKSALQNIFAETIVDTKDEFLQTFSTQRDFIRCITAYLLVAFIPSQICSQLNYDRSLCSL